MTVKELVLQLADQKLQPYRVTSTGQVEAVCPFPHERPKLRRSFYISLKTGLWLCHSCGRRGNLAQLYGQLGLPLPGEDHDQFQQVIAYNPLEELIRRATKKISDVLPEEVASVFLSRGPKSLVQAGFEISVLKQHEIGYDPDLDRFTVPIRSMDGKLRAISGRSMTDAIPKYLVYTRRELAGLVDDKILSSYEPRPKHYLWREHLARRDTEVIVCEGYKAAMWLAQHGYNSVAMMSTSITDHQVDSLRKLEPKRVVLALDDDTAGIDGTLGVAKKLAFVPVLIFDYRTYNSGRSPDDLDEDQLRHGIEGAMPIIRWAVAAEEQKRRLQRQQREERRMRG